MFLHISILVFKQTLEDPSVVLGETNFFQALFEHGRDGVNYIMRKGKPSTKEEREQRLQKMLERFKNEENISDVVVQVL